MARTDQSHLLQMRGLKLLCPSSLFHYEMSHLLQMRGLKLYWTYGVRRRKGRIFYRCVDWNRFIRYSLWHRTCRIFYRCVDWNINIINFRYQSTVASFTDAWIETVDESAQTMTVTSHLLQMRGLKQKIDEREVFPQRRIFYRCVDWNKIYLKRISILIVASFTDAWIETKTGKPDEQLNTSHLLQMRGLKLVTMYAKVNNIESHLLQMRGLKPVLLIPTLPLLRRIFYRCVDWNFA